MSSSRRDSVDRAVAVVGVGAVLPDAFDVATFWNNVLTGRDSISEVPPERWRPEDYFDADPKAPGKTYSKIGGWVRGFAFDPIRLRIPPKVAAAMDEGQKWVLSAAVQAVADAGHPERPLDTERTAVILGNAMGGELHYLTGLRVYAPEYVHALEDGATFRALPEANRRALVAELHEALARRLPDISEDSMPGELANVMAGRVAAVLNLRGPNYTTDAACASSLAALDAAVQGLVDHHYDAVLTGGMDRNMGAPTFVKFCKIGALSATGSRPYADGADGFVMGEGGALFLLKRLEDAERDGDRIYAVIRSVGGSSDGKGKGITAPNPVGQILAIRRAWERAGLTPDTMGLLEGHGTSTRVGDLAELQSATEALAGVRPGSIALGSIKSQIGHLKSGAGAAGLLKAVLAVHHRILPPSIHFDAPNPGYDWASSPFFVNTQARTWERPAGGVRRAGLSAFGFGGTNFHVVLEEHVPGMLTSRRTMTDVPQQLTSAPASAAPAPLAGVLALGASDVAGLAAGLKRALEEARAGRLPPKRTPDASVRRAPERLVIAWDDAADLIAKAEKALGAFERGDPRTWRLLQSKGIHRGTGAAPTVAFLFPGQGSQYLNMLRGLAEVEPVVAETFREADEVMTPLLEGRSLTSYLFVDETDPAALERHERALRHTTITQPAMLTCDVALTRLLVHHGVQPDLLMGHSLGEWAAVVASGICSFADALRAVSARAHGMADLAPPDPGKMASVIGPYEEIVARLNEVGGYVIPANLNSRNQTVIAGASEAVDRAVAYFNAGGFQAQTIPVSHAFHSEIVAQAAGVLRKALAALDLRLPQVPVVGNVEGAVYPPDLDRIRELLAVQIASPVQFVRGLETAYEAGARLFVEVGPKRVLQTFAENVLGDREGVTCLSTNHPKRGDVASFHEALCGIWAAGLPEADREARIEVRPAALTRTAPPTPASTSAPAAPAPAAPRDGQPDYDAMGRLLARFLDESRALYPERPVPASTPAPAVATPAGTRGSIVISGAGLGLPGRTGRVFGDDQVDRILRGDLFIDSIDEPTRRRMVDKNVVRLVKREVGEPSLESISNVDEVIKLAAQRGAFDLAAEYGVDADRVGAYDITTSLAVAAALEALRDAGIPLVRHYRRTTTGSLLPDRWLLPRSMADETGVIFASAFPGYNNLVDDIQRHQADRFQGALIEELRRIHGDLDPGSGVATALGARISELEAAHAQSRFVFDRRFLFRVLAMGHSQLAELVGVRGPNTQVNAACASTTLAVSLAEDWLRAGRCRRVLIVGADDVTSDKMLEWIGAGFLATGAATTESVVEKAALPFDRRRHGMLLGMGACALVIEAQDAVAERGMRGIAEVLGTETANSAFHGTRLDVDHIASVMERLVSTAERNHGLDRGAMARETVFISHETYTPARGGSAAAEVHALRRTFGAEADSVVVCNTKGYTGHPMGVGIEDAVAAKILEKQLVPPVPNFKEPDPELGVLNLSKGGRYPVRYALRLAAGFGSQISMTLTRRVPGVEQRVADDAAYRRWLSDVSGLDGAELEVTQRTLRVRDTGRPAREPAASTWVHGQPPRGTISAPAGAAPPAPTPPAAATPAAVAPVAAVPAPVTSAPAAPPPSAADSTADAVAEQVLALVGEKTGYPRDMLDLDLDLEADLGIDTVKQAEVFAMVREAFDIPRQDDLKLREYPTLGHVIGFVRKFRPDLAAAAPAAASAPAPAASAPAASAPASGPDPVAEQVLALVGEKTGYPRDMLELDLDLEADLGIDTVKQAEVFAMVREAFDIPRQDDLKLREYPTLGHVIGFVRQFRPDLAAAAPAPAAPAVPVATAPAVATAADADPVAEQVLGVVSEKTGYPRDMLELDLDLEADLGIDTVKQAEVFAMVREAFDIPRQDDLKLREYPTLGHVIGFVRKFRPDLATQAPAPAPVPAPVAPETAATAAAAASDADPVVERVLAVVSEKTGYPRDMLELDLDMEADLGIDTVKQAEVFALVRESFGIARQDDLKLRDYPTLKDVIGFVRKFSTAPAAATEAPVEATTAAEPAGGPAPLFRTPRAMLRPDLDLCKETGVRLSTGDRVVIVGDAGGAADALADRLGARGVDVLCIPDEPDPRELEKQLAEWSAAGGVRGAYFLPALDPDPAFGKLDLGAWRQLHRRGVKSLHALARTLYEPLAAPGTFLVTASRLGGVHGYGPQGAANASGGAVTGFTKAFGRERPECLVKAVDFEEKASADEIADALLEEVERDPGAVEIGRQAGLRWGIGVVECEAAEEGAALPLDEDSVFVVTGAAGAITSAIVRDLAVHTRGTFHLLDALPEPDAETRALVPRLAAEREVLKREIFEQLKASGTRATPALVEQRLFGIERAAAILDVVGAVEDAGGKAHYHQVDVTSAEAVKQVLGAVKKASGRMDVLLHAAGLERSKSLDHKPVEEFELVFDVKADGLFNLLRPAGRMGLKGLVCFSSVAGRFGNAGQTDYSAANDLMCKVAPWWAGQRDGRLAVVLDWTAWGGIGMATRGNIPEIMKRAGIEMLTPEDGIPVVRERLTQGHAGEVVVGRRLGILLDTRDEAGGLDAHRVATRTRSGALTFEAVTADVHRGVQAAITLDPKAEPFLEDHRIEGIPVLPGVMGLEGFAGFARLLAPGLAVEAIEDVRFLAPLKYYRDEPRTAVFRGLPVWSADGRVRLEATLSSSRAVVGSNRPAEEKVHFQATVVLGRPGEARPARMDGTPPVGSAPIDREAIYRVFFHGPAYRVLSSARRTGQGLAGRFAPGLPPDLGREGAASVFEPRLIELCFQTAGVWEIGSAGQLGLPAAADRLVVRERPADLEDLVAEVFVRGTADAPVFDARVRDEEGRVYVEVEGYRTSRLPGGLTEPELAPFRAVAG